MNMQLSLPVNTSDKVSFESFVFGENQQAIDSLKKLITKDETAPFLFYLFGEKGCGKSHLLISLCHYAHARGLDAIYIDLKQTQELVPDVLSNLEASSIICLDGLENIKSSVEWQEAVFDLINRVKEQGDTSIVISGREALSSLSLTLADLKSRLSWGLSYAITPLNDTEKQELIIKRAKQRGMVLSTEVAKFLLSHCERDTQSLMRILDRLDKLSLQQKRKLSIPFVKSALSL
ncbi:DnaA regulatory inactivator Hda [Alteromonadaceae bacterium M269]|nr:DnaA regulatory inactivator Hda [Alteromonadaceae bacterium M269]